jgi:hypothetical protein
VPSWPVLWDPTLYDVLPSCLHMLVLAAMQLPFHWLPSMSDPVYGDGKFHQAVAAVASCHLGARVLASLGDLGSPELAYRRVIYLWKWAAIFRYLAHI